MPRKRTDAATLSVPNKKSSAAVRQPKISLEERIAKESDNSAEVSDTKVGVNKKQFGLHVGLSINEINRLDALGVLPEFKKSTLATMRISFVDYLRRAAAGQVVNDGGKLIDIDTERAKLTREKVIGEIRHNMTQAGELVVREDEVERLLKGVIAAKSILRGLPKIIRTKMGLSVEVAQEVGRLIDKALLSVAEEFGVEVDTPQYVERVLSKKGRKRAPYRKKAKAKKPAKKKSAPRAKKS